MHHNTWRKSLRKFIRKSGATIPNLLKADLTETKYGHRVIDQIFREGKFAPKDYKRSEGRKAHH